MSVKIRLRRLGTKKRPFYRIVIADSRSPRDGRFIETVGLYHPLTDPATITIDEEKISIWLEKGAIPTETVRSLLKRAGFFHRRELKKRGIEAPSMEVAGAVPGPPKASVTAPSEVETKAMVEAQEPAEVERDVPPEEEEKVQAKPRRRTPRKKAVTETKSAKGPTKAETEETTGDETTNESEE